MPTPRIYRDLAALLRPKRPMLWLSVVFGVILLFGSIFFFAIGQAQAFTNLPIALGFVVVTVAWGLICIESWFSDRPPGFIARKLQNAFPRIYDSSKAAIEWYAALFLILWFGVSLVAGIVLLAKF